MVTPSDEMIHFARMLKQHHDGIIESLRKSIQQYRNLPKESQTKYTRNQILYWEKAISAMEWSTSIAMQKAKINE